MTFTRTPAGLSNLHIFFSVDVVVYVEGGTRTYTFSEVRAGSGDEQSEDVAFWQRIFSTFSPGRTYKFRAVGSKDTVSQIADDIIDHGLTTVYVAMDRDFDNVKGTLKIAPGIFYTFGYSWENDVWQPDVIKDTFYELCPVCPAGISPDAQIQSCFNNFEREMRWVVYADLLFNLHDLAFKDLRDKPNSVILLGANGKPRINRARIRQLIKESKLVRIAPLMTGRKIRLSVLTDCYGHLVSIFGFRVIAYLLRILCSNMPKIAIIYTNLAAIRSFIAQLNSGRLPAIKNHYDRQFALI